MAHNKGILGPNDQGAEMLESEAVQALFTLRRLGWGMKSIAEELGISGNTVRSWLRKGARRQYSGPVRAPMLAGHLAWLRERFLAGVRNGDVLRQELATRGVLASLRTVNRALWPLRQELVLANRATVRFETPPGCQMQVDFGEKWLEFGGVAQKRYLFVATLGYSRRTFAVTHKEGFVVGIQTYPDNPYDGHTLEGQLDQVERLTGKVPGTTFVDRGYRGHGVPDERSQVLISGTRWLGHALKLHLRRRSAVEPEIGHMKNDGLLGRNFLKGMASDAMNAFLCGAGHNLHKILTWARLCLYEWAAAPVPKFCTLRLVVILHLQAA